VILGWTALGPSARHDALRAGALIVAVGCALLLMGAAALADPRSPALMVGAAGVAALAVLLAAWPRRRSAHEVAVDRDGAVRLRPAGGDLSFPAECAYVAPWLITLRAGAIWVPIWPDSVPREAFRRLSACVLWARAPADPVANDNNERG
jgi:hypothetical protein